MSAYLCVSLFNYHLFFKKDFFFNVDHFFFVKYLLNFLQCCLRFMFWFFWPQGMWDLSSLTRDRTRTLCFGRWSLNHRLPGKSLSSLYLFIHFSHCSKMDLRLIQIRITTNVPAHTLTHIHVLSFLWERLTDDRYINRQRNKIRRLYPYKC